MPLFYQSHTFPTLRKSDKSKSTDILFKMKDDIIDLKNFQSIQSYYTVELISYPSVMKVQIIRFLKKYTSLKVKKIQELLTTTPQILLNDIPKKDVTKLEIGLLMLGAKVRIS